MVWVEIIYEVISVMQRQKAINSINFLNETFKTDWKSGQSIKHPDSVKSNELLNSGDIGFLF